MTPHYADWPLGGRLPFKPVRLLLAYDDAGGLCARVVPRMKDMLEQRAFEVDVHVLGADPPDLEGYKGVVLGTPVLGAGLRRRGASASALRFVESADALDERKLALFSVFRAWPGRALEELRAAADARGVPVVVDYAYWSYAPEQGEHIVPAECMVRIR